MGQQNTEMDIESLKNSDRRRGNCLDVFLVVSVIFLFIAVTAVAAGGVMAVRQLQSMSRREVNSSLPSSESSQLKGDASSPVYKMENFAYLEATESKLKNYTMHWAPVDYGTQKTVGSNFIFVPEHHSLQVKRTGTYFMYIDLNFTCTFKCKPGLVSVHLGDKLTCKVQLPATNSTTTNSPVSRKCWTVSLLQVETKLLAQMTVPEGLDLWKLELNSSRLGMFLVD